VFKQAQILLSQLEPVSALSNLLELTLIVFFLLSFFFFSLDDADKGQIGPD
jgi:hypothetical protein